MISSREDLESGPVAMTVTEFEADMVVEDKTTVADGVVRLILRDQGGRRAAALGARLARRSHRRRPDPAVLAVR